MGGERLTELSKGQVVQLANVQQLCCYFWVVCQYGALAAVVFGKHYYFITTTSPCSKENYMLLCCPQLTIKHEIWLIFSPDAKIALLVIKRTSIRSKEAIM